jgi:hypothetical protein
VKNLLTPENRWWTLTIIAGILSIISGTMYLSQPTPSERLLTEIRDLLIEIRNQHK